jgi:hypothetical protein
MDGSSKLKVGDEIKVLLDSRRNITDDKRQYKDIVKLQIIKRKQTSSVCFVPNYIFVKHTKKCNSKLINELDLDNKWLNTDIIIVCDSAIIEVVKRQDGAVCDNCNHFYSYAEYDENEDFTCYLCKQNPYRCKF